jgi:hypothetical protein
MVIPFQGIEETRQYVVAHVFSIRRFLDRVLIVALRHLLQVDEHLRKCQAEK